MIEAQRNECPHPLEADGRARISDIGRVELADWVGSPEMQRDVLGCWLLAAQSMPGIWPCDQCETFDVDGRGYDAWPKPFTGWHWYGGRPGHCDTCFRRCETCNGKPYAYLANFNTDWLVDVMLNHFGGDISRVPTLDELKGLL